MRKALKVVFSAARAAGSFVRATFGPRDREVGRDAQGRSRLDGWEQVPETRVAAAAKALSQRRRAAGRWGLMGLSGPHRGELLLLREDRERLGAGSSSSVVVTPGGAAQGRYLASLDDGLHLAGEGEAAFRVNGREERSAELFDYDELDLLGNRFLVLRIEGAAAGERRNAEGSES